MENQKQTVHTKEFGKVELIAPSNSYQQPVIVEKSVVTRLAQLLQKSSLLSIKRQFSTLLEGVDSIEEYVELLQDELAFHRTVNILTTISPKLVGKIDLDERSTKTELEQANFETSEHLEQ